MGTPEASLEQREFESDGWRKEPEALKPDIELIKIEVKGRGLVLATLIYILYLHVIETWRKRTTVNAEMNDS